jgi:hypothetical protein
MVRNNPWSGISRNRAPFAELTQFGEKMLRTSCFLIIVLLLSFSLPPMLRAEEDPVIKTINEAVQQYKSGQFAGAITSLDYASQIIRQKKGEVLGRLLPEPFEGWAAEQVDAKALGAAMFGGATTAERRYIKDNSSISVKFSTDSPMMQSMLMMFSNPIFASSVGKIELINGQKAIVDFKETSGNINIVIGNSLLITIDGSHVRRDDLLAYAGRIDMDKLSKLP